ncbi:hypothetical protein HA402_014345 [Bradysia odoriphaga]|nr:hypothetical protein HA402_014345 [Bradysia odoriphaga]
MGCQISRKNDSDQSNDLVITAESQSTMTNQYPDAEINYKARLEKKLCLAKETPEPEFDLSDCQLKDVPSGVFVMCRVLRKEKLLLNRNKLRTLNGGGLLGDLTLLQILDLRWNNLRKLPENLSVLQNLRELMVSHNQLESLPSGINRMRNLELLDVSHNNLTEINPINCMSHLRILNIAANPKLFTLPNELATCDSLVDIVLSNEIVTHPPANVLELGTLQILNFLTTGEVDMNAQPQRIPWQDSPILVSEEFGAVNDTKFEYTKFANEKFIEHEQLETNSQLEAQLYLKQKKRNQEFLEQLLQQQNQNDDLVNKLQQEKDSQRNKLIDDILEAERNASLIVENLLNLKNEPDPTLLELEHREQQILLEQLHIQHDDLRKQEVLSAMSNILAAEAKKIENYQDQRDITTRNILNNEHETNELLSNMFANNDRDRTEVVIKIMQDEDLQKSAVVTLIAGNDARTWGLMEQMRIVESQLAAMTCYEIERKKLSADEQLNEQSSQRLNLTCILIDLMEQQESRRKQLFDTLIDIEQQNKFQQEDFWLLQYQKLIDSRPADLSISPNSVDPALGYNFLVNGVVHCLPFLSKIWHTKGKDLASITDDDLSSAGISKTIDRSNILLSIKQFLDMDRPVIAGASIKQSDSAADVDVQQPTIAKDDTQKGELLAECVICMENSCQIIFLPCGHMCCCLNCHNDVQLCPMCRSEIDRRIKVIQP